MSAISVSKSLDDGSNFGNPVVAAGKDAFTHFLDKPWMAIDPTNANRIFVTYTDFDVSGSLCGLDSNGFPIARIAIELVRSTVGGASWTAPVVIDEVCSPASVPGLLVQGSQVAVGPDGKVYVAWEFFAEDFFTREQRIRRSTNQGASFSPFVKVDDVIPVGDGFALQGGFRSAFEFPSLAVDRSGTATNANVYLTWHDGRNLQVTDFAAGVYGYADVLISRSRIKERPGLLLYGSTPTIEPLATVVARISTSPERPSIKRERSRSAGTTGVTIPRTSLWTASAVSPRTPERPGLTDGTARPVGSRFTQPRS